ncbi:Pyruvate kinase [Dictyocoela roeselum]|nr:Pyruvate kinase [Dictyocoela roeselum]
MLLDLEDVIDFVFISFVNSAADVVAIKNIFKKKKPLLYAKIESEEAVANLQEIINVSDGIMIARGDLGIAVGFENLFSVQAKILGTCKKMKKPVIMATQMLESMTNNRYPTRAEVTDIGYAVANSCECVMLSGESSIGTFPVECVEMMRAICRDAETLQTSDSPTFSIDAVVVIAGKWKDFKKDFKKYGVDGMPLFVVSANVEMLRKATIMRDVHPIYVDEGAVQNVDDVVERIKVMGMLKGKKVIIFCVGKDENERIVRF